MSIIPTYIPFTSAVLERCIAELSALYPFVQTETFGTSRMGKPLYALRIGHGAQAIGYNAAHHANEWITSVVLMHFLEEFCAFCADNREMLERITLHAMPMVNPDGVDLLTGAITPTQQVYQDAAAMSKAADPSLPFPNGWKANVCGVDLNSNYPASWELAREKKYAQGFTQAGPRGFVGTAPLCEPESSAMAAYTKLCDFALTLSLHTQGEEIYWRYRDFNPPRAKELAKVMQTASGYACMDVPDNASHAGYRDWFIETFNRPGFTIECGLGENPLPISDFAGIYKKTAPILWVPLNK